MADKTITVTSNLINVLAANPGITLTQSQFGSVTSGDTELIGGCIRRLYYLNNGEDLDIVFFDNGTRITEAQARNLKEFRELFECAAKHGMGATMCWDRSERRIYMVNLYPCLCSCPDGEGKGKPARDFERLSRS